MQPVSAMIQARSKLILTINSFMFIKDLFSISGADWGSVCVFATRPFSQKQTEYPGKALNYFYFLQLSYLSSGLCDKK